MKMESFAWIGSVSSLSTSSHWSSFFKLPGWGNWSIPLSKINKQIFFKCKKCAHETEVVGTASMSGLRNDWEDEDGISSWANDEPEP